MIVDSLGVVGRRLGSLRSWDWSVIGEQLATRDPRLVVLQYGTNEADDPDLDLEAMARYYDETILADPRRGTDRVDPDPRAARHGRARGGQGVRPDEASPDGTVIPECQWRTPSVLGEIIAVEHAAAARNKVAFFDTFVGDGRRATRCTPGSSTEPKTRLQGSRPLHRRRLPALGRLAVERAARGLRTLAARMRCRRARLESPLAPPRAERRSLPGPIAP